MIRARKLLRDSFNFLFENPILFFYGFIYLLPVMIAILGVLLVTVSVGTLSFITFNFPEIVRTVFGVLFGSFFALFFMALFFFAIAVASLGITIYIQAHLRGSSLSVKGSLKKSLAICSSVLWVVPIYLLYFCINNSRLWIFAFIAFCYVPQLLYDGHTSLGDSFSTSWNYFKKTFWVMLRFFILISLIAFLLIFAAVSLLLLAALSMRVPGASLIFALSSIIVFFGLFLLSIIGSMIAIIGINKLYVEVKQQN